MTIACIMPCRENQVPIVDDDAPFTPHALGDLVRLTDDSTTVTLLDGRTQATLREEDGVLMLTAQGKRYTYALRIMKGCVHASVRDRGVRSRVRASVCLNSVRGVYAMLESIICDEPANIPR